MQRAVRTEMPEGHEHRSDDYETENVDGKEVCTKTKRTQKAKMSRAQGNELCHKGEGDVLRLVPATNAKYHSWNTLFKKEAVAACACNQKASKAVWARAIMLQITDGFEADEGPCEKVIEKELEESMKLGWRKQVQLHATLQNCI